MVFSTGGMVCKEGPRVVGRGREGVEGSPEGSLHILNINEKTTYLIYML